MLSVSINAQTLHGSSADVIVRQHAFDSNVHCVLRLLLHQIAVGDFLEVANPAGVPDLELLKSFLPVRTALPQLMMIT